MSKMLQFDTNARDSIMKGVNKLANAVKVTLGPAGRNVMISTNMGAPIVTKDGVTVARAIDLTDPYENQGAQMAKSVAAKTNDIAGDGTTTATVLAQAIAKEGLKVVAAGANPMDVKRGIDITVEKIIETIDKIAIPVEDKEKIKQVATISANSDSEIGNLIADALEQVGIEGVITVEEGKSADTTLTIVKGMQFDNGLVSPYFTPNNQPITLEDAYVLLYNQKITAMKDLIPLLEQVARTNKPLLILCDDLEGEALATLLINKARGTLNAIAVKAPEYGEQRKRMLEDIGVLTNGQLICDDFGVTLDEVSIDMLGQAKSVTVDTASTLIVGYDNDETKNAVAQRADEIRTEIAKTTSEYEVENLKNRLAKLVGGVAVISVGAVTEVEMKEKKYRIDDAVNATKAAVAEGIVPGGGTALIRASVIAQENTYVAGTDVLAGYNIVMRAIEEPLRQIVTNAGLEGSVICNKVKLETGNVGYNAKTDIFEDLVKAGVIDPAKVTKTALRNAASIASMILTTDCVIVEKPEEHKCECNAQAPMGMSGIM
jgi:chaperonin GroEL